MNRGGRCSRCLTINCGKNRQFQVNADLGLADFSTPPQVSPVITLIFSFFAHGISLALYSMAALISFREARHVIVEVPLISILNLTGI